MLPLKISIDVLTFDIIVHLLDIELVFDQLVLDTWMLHFIPEFKKEYTHFYFSIHRCS